MDGKLKQPKLTDKAVDRVATHILKMGINRGADNLKLLCISKRYVSEFLELGMAKAYGIRFCVAVGLYKAFHELMIASHPGKMERQESPWIEINTLANDLAWYLVRYDRLFSAPHGRRSFEDQINLIAFKIYGTAIHPSSTSSGTSLTKLIRDQLPG